MGPQLSCLMKQTKAIKYESQNVRCKCKTKLQAIIHICFILTYMRCEHKVPTAIKIVVMVAATIIFVLMCMFAFIFIAICISILIFAFIHSHCIYIFNIKLSGLVYKRMQVFRLRIVGACKKNTYKSKNILKVVVCHVGDTNPLHPNAPKHMLKKLDNAFWILFAYLWICCLHTVTCSFNLPVLAKLNAGNICFQK